MRELCVERDEPSPRPSEPPGTRPKTNPVQAPNHTPHPSGASRTWFSPSSDKLWIEGASRIRAPALGEARPSRSSLSAQVHPGQSEPGRYPGPIPAAPMPCHPQAAAICHTRRHLSPSFPVPPVSSARAIPSQNTAPAPPSPEIATVGTSQAANPHDSQTCLMSSPRPSPRLLNATVHPNHYHSP